MTSRRGSRLWGTPAPRWALPPQVDVLIPTLDRPTELAVTLAGLAAQDDPSFGVVISSQSAGGAPFGEPSIQAMIRVLEAQGRRVEVYDNHPPRGMAAQRQFLLEKSRAEFVLFLDDDVWLEPGQLDRMVVAIRELGCGFVGAAVQGLSYLDDIRPTEHDSFELWTEGVHPESIRRGAPGFDRWKLHNAANLTHIASGLSIEPEEWLAYRIAWVGGCVLYRRENLISVGGFDFADGLASRGFAADGLPADHAGEDVAAQWRVMRVFGGAGILPSGAVHLEAPTTLPVRSVDAFDLLWPEVRAQA